MTALRPRYVWQFWSSRSSLRATITVGAILAIASFLVFRYSNFSLASSRPHRLHISPAPRPGNTKSGSQSPWCPAGGDDVFVILKTGATEAARLPILLNTVFQCIPHYAIFSDFEENSHGKHVYDSLDEFDDDLLAQEEELRFYKRIKEYRRQGKPLEGLFRNDGAEKESTLPWKLDKWKFFPMVKKAYRMKKAKWYVFIEADTYLSWGNLLRWLSMMDPSKELYLGNPNVINDDLFAHGGSGIVMSAPALKKLSEHLESKPEYFVNMTRQVCCGDFAVGQALVEVGVKLTWVWPLIQGETPQSLDYTERQWCYPAITHHHMSPEQIDAVWRYEQARMPTDERPVIFKDFYDAFIGPNLTPRMANWDNLCEALLISSKELKADWLTDASKSALESEENCRKLCEHDANCLQYTWMDGACELNHAIRYGKTANGHHAGYLMDRVAQTVKSMGDCRDVKWITDTRRD